MALLRCPVTGQNFRHSTQNPPNREDICLKTLLLFSKCANINHRNKRRFVSTTNEALVGTLMIIGDVNDIFIFHIIFHSKHGLCTS